ncbi:MAG TPA: PHB depolymerase family esterase [Candidatus Dormibacteraeota bacterium]|nr:PHB depolymerase family esterase [Candidatus Dormibacteraeota bacterium]
MRVRPLLVASSLAGLALAGLWCFTFLVFLPGRVGGLLLLRDALVLPDRVLGWQDAPHTVLQAYLMFYVPAVLLSLLAIGLWTASMRSRTATVAAALLIGAAITGVLVGAFPYDGHTYQASPVRGTAGAVFLFSLTCGAILSGVGLRRSQRRGLGLFSLVLGLVMAWVAVVASALGAFLGAKQPQLVALIALQALAAVWYVGNGIGLAWLSRPGGRAPTPRRFPVPHVGKALTALGTAITAVTLVIVGGYFGPSAAAQLTGRTQLGSLRIGTVDRTYRVYRPAQVAARPGLVIVLHGAYGSGLQMEVWTHFDSQADRLRWIAAYPDGILDGWDTFGDGPDWGQHPGVDDVQFVAALIDHFEATDQVDPDRVYVTGISRGAMMSYRLGCELASRIAAIAPVAGNMATESGSAQGVGCRPARPISVLAIQGTADPEVPFHGGRTDIIYAPFDDVIGVWRDVDACNASSSAGTSGPVTTTTWLCRGGSAVETSVIAGGVHAWPGARPTAQPLLLTHPPDDALDASTAIADFFASHRRASTPPA